MSKYKPVWDSRRKGWSFELGGGLQGTSAVYFGNSKSEAGFVFTKYNVRNRLPERDVTDKDLAQIRTWHGTVLRGGRFFPMADFDRVVKTVEVDGKTYSRTEYHLKKSCATRRKLNELRAKYAAPDSNPAQD